MKNFAQFHDGFMDGLLLDGKAVRLFLRTYDEEVFALDVSGVKSLELNDFRQGNIIFDVVVREGTEVRLSDVEELLGFSDEAKALLRLQELHSEGALVIEINPSYGASCKILASAATLTRRPKAD